MALSFTETHCKVLAQPPFAPASGSQSQAIKDIVFLHLFPTTFTTLIWKGLCFYILHKIESTSSGRRATNLCSHPQAGKLTFLIIDT